jgi:hypothetical protein
MVLGLAMADDGQSSQVAYDAEIHPDSDLESADLSRLQDGSDSVHQGDNVGQKVESQTINDADAIARIALESYKQALKDMGKED